MQSIMLTVTSILLRQISCVYRSSKQNHVVNATLCGEPSVDAQAVMLKLEAPSMCHPGQYPYLTPCRALPVSMYLITGACYYVHFGADPEKWHLTHFCGLHSSGHVSVLVKNTGTTSFGGRLVDILEA